MRGLDKKGIKQLLDKAVEEYNRLDFIDSDPIQIPHRFSRKEDIEIAGFMASTIAWGQRKTIIRNGERLMDIMENAPYEFLMDDKALLQSETTVRGFVHRTFNGGDCFSFLLSLQNIYRNHGGLEAVFTEGYQQEKSIYSALRHFRAIFFEIPAEARTGRHLSNVEKNSAAKRLNMYLRWMVRHDENHVDFGLWREIPMSALMLPLDVHTGNVGRALGLLSRRQNDWKAVEEITALLREFDPEDPIKYDYALFGLGVSGVMF